MYFQKYSKNNSMSIKKTPQKLGLGVKHRSRIWGTCSPSQKVQRLQHVTSSDGLQPNSILVPSSFLFLVVRPGAPSSVRSLLVAMPFVTSSFWFTFVFEFASHILRRSQSASQVWQLGKLPHQSLTSHNTNQHNTQHKSKRQF